MDDAISVALKTGPKVIFGLVPLTPLGSHRQLSALGQHLFFEPLDALADRLGSVGASLTVAHPSKLASGYDMTPSKGASR